MNKYKLTFSALGLGLVLFFAINVLAQAGLRGVRMDLTEEKLFTLSDGARAVAEKLEEPVKLSYFLSRAGTDQYPTLKSYGTRVREVLEEFARASDGTLTLEEIDPEPYSEEEDRAVQAGLNPIPVGNLGEKAYFGLVGRNTLGDEELIAVFDPQKERFLEYDLARLVHMLSAPERPVVGVLSTLPISGGPPDPRTRQATPPWQAIGLLGELSEVQELEPTLTAVPDDVDVLLVVHPKQLADGARYAIDQFVLGGGRTVVFTDPLCEADAPPADPSNPFAAMQAERSSDLPELFAAWGLRLVPGFVAADRAYAQRVSVGGQQGEAVDYVVWNRFTDPENFNQDDAVTGQLTAITVAQAGILEAVDDASMEFTMLLQTSEQGARIDSARLKMFPDPKELLANYLPEGRQTLAARVTGPAQSAFPDGAPEGVQAGEHRSESDGPIQVVVVADVDLLADRWWITQDFFGLRKSADNGNLLLNIVEQFSGSDDLIAIRGRTFSTRPFDKVAAIRRDAEQRFRQREIELETRLRELDSKLQELQFDPEQGTIMLTADQLEALQLAREERQDTNVELREVKHSQRQDIERLGLAVKLANVAGLPLFVALLAVGIGTWRVQRRKQA